MNVRDYFVSLRAFQGETEKESPLQLIEPTIQQQIDDFERHLKQMTRFYRQAVTLLAAQQMLRELNLQPDPSARVWPVQQPKRWLGVQFVLKVGRLLWTWVSVLAKLGLRVKRKSGASSHAQPIIIDVHPDDIIEPDRWADYV
jgi:hypothetical protein